MKTYRKSREEYRTLGKGYYHFCTDGWKEGNIFNSIAQYAYGMVLIGLISLKYSIVIYDFTLMPNHIHIIMSGTGEAALEAFGYLKRKLNKMLEADGYRPLPEEYSFRLEPVKDKDQMRLGYRPTLSINSSGQRTSGSTSGLPGNEMHKNGLKRVNGCPR